MILGLIQARTSSTRLPGKVMKKLFDLPMLAHQVQRAKQSKLIDKLIVVTSDDSSDDVLEQMCLEQGIDCFRGSLDDVLDRFYQAAKKEGAKHIVRLTGDCPLIDPSLIDSVIEFYLEGELDYASNALEPTFPDGLDTEVFSFSALERASARAAKPSQREHVTSYIYNNPDEFNIGVFKSDVDLSSHRWTVDTKEDFEFVSRVFEHLYPKNKHFNYMDVLELLEQEPDLVKINSMYERNEGYKE